MALQVVVEIEGDSEPLAQSSDSSDEEDVIGAGSVRFLLLQAARLFLNVWIRMLTTT
jgi:hypothetical protein